MYIIMRRLRQDGMPANHVFEWSFWMPSTRDASQYDNPAYHAKLAARLERNANKRDGEGKWQYRAFKLVMVEAP